MNAGTVGSHLMVDIGFTAEEKNERRFLCHMVEGVPWLREGYVGRRGHQWSSLMVCGQLSVSSMTCCVPLSYHFSNNSHVVLFISMTTPCSQNRTKRHWKQQRLRVAWYASSPDSPYRTPRMLWVVVFDNTHTLQRTYTN